jgi:hypothetical protein
MSRRETKEHSKEKAKPSIRLKVFKNGSEPQIVVDHEDKQIGPALIMEAFASADEDFVQGILSQLANASAHGRDVDEGGLNFMLSVIKGIEARDQLEAMLAAQMAAVHIASMTFARRLARVETLAQQDSAERALNKLARTFAMQMEGLKRYRTGAQQKVTLQHVSVADGGQAIVGNVMQVPHDNGQENAAAPLAPALSNTNVVPMPTSDKNKEHDPLPVRRRSNK